MKFQIVTNRARDSEVFDTGPSTHWRAAWDAFIARGYEITGSEHGTHLRAELHGQPKVKGLCGPMWGGTDEQGRWIIRYEDWESYEVLST